MAMMMTAREVINKESLTILLIRFCSDIEIIKTTTDFITDKHGQDKSFYYFIVSLCLSVSLCGFIKVLLFYSSLISILSSSTAALYAGSGFGAGPPRTFPYKSNLAA